MPLQNDWLTEVVEGWTGRLTFTLVANGADLNGTGMTVTDMILTGSDGGLIDTASDFGWVSDAAGTVYYDPDASDFKAERSPYKVRFEVTDGAGKKVYFSNAQPDEIKVHPK